MPVSSAVTSISEAVEELAARVQQELRAGDRFTRVKVEMESSSVDLIRWLDSRTDSARLYWSNRDNAFEMAGVGIADCVAGDDPARVIAEVRTRLQTCRDHQRYYGGCRFAAQAESSNAGLWDDFGVARFVLPRFELTREGDVTALCCNLIPGDVDRGDDLVAELNRLPDVSSEAEPTPPKVLRRTDLPDRRDWERIVSELLAGIERGAFNKVVLARQTALHLAESLEPCRLLRYLNERAFECYHFCLQWREGNAFVGASPERLYRRRGRDIETEAVAGTRTRGVTPDDDARLTSDLRKSDKDVSEQQLVAQGVERSLERLCGSYVRIPGTSSREVRKLAHVQHLVTRFEGTLNNGVADSDVLSALHPTPAVGGVPTSTALDEIERLESFDRGWYAGPVGWIGRDAAEFAVGIRSALAVENTLHLFGGAGIVRGSVPNEEWDEVEAKLGVFLDFLEDS